MNGLPRFQISCCSREMWFDWDLILFRNSANMCAFWYLQPKVSIEDSTASEQLLLPSPWSVLHHLKNRKPWWPLSSAARLSLFFLQKKNLLQKVSKSQKVEASSVGLFGGIPTRWITCGCTNPPALGQVYMGLSINCSATIIIAHSTHLDTCAYGHSYIRMLKQTLLTSLPPKFWVAASSSWARVAPKNNSCGSPYKGPSYHFWKIRFHCDFHSAGPLNVIRISESTHEATRKIPPNQTVTKLKWDFLFQRFCGWSLSLFRPFSSNLRPLGTCKRLPQNLVFRGASVVCAYRCMSVCMHVCICMYLTY